MDDKKAKELEEELNELRKEFHEYVRRKQREEAQRLKTALMSAGGIILALGSFIWWEIVWPVINGGRQ